MAINTSYAGNIPWLSETTGAQALATGVAAGSQIGQLRLQRAQEQRLQRAASQVARQELSRQLGMKRATNQIDAYKMANPNATDEQINKVRKRAVFDNASEIFAANPEAYLREMNTDTANEIRRTADQQLNEDRIRNDNIIAGKNAEINELRLLGLLSKAEADRMSSELTKARDDNRVLHERTRDKLEERKVELQERKDLREETDAWLGVGKGYAPSEAGKKADELARILKRELTEDEIAILYGQKARPGVTHEMVENEYIAKKLEAWLKGDEGMSKTRQQGIDALRKEFRENYIPQAAEPAGEVGPAPTSTNSLSTEFFKSPFNRQKKK